jgi:photosystem II stability/assembly factor-like uncharacterized protein
MEINLGNYLISSMALNPDKSHLFVGTEQGLFVSQDAGQTWQDALASLALKEPVVITTIVCIPQEGKAPLIVAGTMGGFLRSEDGGQTWQFVSAGTPAPLISALAAADTAKMVAGTSEDGVLVSQDGGLSWVRWNFGLLDWHIFSLVSVRGPDGKITILSGVESGLFSSVNGGRAWREVDFPEDAGAVLALGVAQDAEEAPIFAGTEQGALFRSQDRGYSWERIAEGVFDAEISGLIVSGVSVLVASGEYLRISHDRGDTWKDWNSQVLFPGSIHTVAAPGGLKSGAELLVACEGRIFRIAER